MFAEISLSQRGEIRNFAGQLRPHRRSMQQAAPFQEVKKDLAIRAQVLGRSGRPMDRLCQSGMVDKGASLLGKRSRGQDIFGPCTRRRGEEILNDDQGNPAERLRLGLGDPTSRTRRIARSQVQRVETSSAGQPQQLIEAQRFSLEVAKDGFNPPPIGTFLLPNGKFHRLHRLATAILGIGIVLAHDRNGAEEKSDVGRQPFQILGQQVRFLAGQERR